jgi:hypothetical protein
MTFAVMKKSTVIGPVEFCVVLAALPVLLPVVPIVLLFPETAFPPVVPLLAVFSPPTHPLNAVASINPIVAKATKFTNFMLSPPQRGNVRVEYKNIKVAGEKTKKIENEEES